MIKVKFCLWKHVVIAFGVRIGFKNYVSKADKFLKKVFFVLILGLVYIHLYISFFLRRGNLWNSNFVPMHSSLQKKVQNKTQNKTFKWKFKI